MKKHTKAYGIYLWDTFDNQTILLDEKDTLPEAEEYIKERGGLRPNGADKIEIVNSKGDIVKQYSCG